MGEPDEHGALSPDSTVKPDWSLINYLFSAGRDEAEKWISRRRSSVDLKARFLLPRRPKSGARGTGLLRKRRKKSAVGADIPD